MKSILKNKQGDFTGVIYLIVSITAFAIFLLIIGYVAPQISTQIKNQIGTSTLINQSLDTTTNITQNTLPTIWLMVFSGLCLSLLVTAFFIETHPIFVPIYIILLVIAIIISVPLSNAYESLTQDAVLSSTSNYQVAIKFIMFQLPLITFIVGLIVMIVAFAKPGYGGATLG